ncbi:MAG: blaR1 2 [Mucilaginibacter sp.]|nr:blaR1 2 [Mucilaginibacter sp.]
MENVFYNISQVLGITIIHSLWQALLIYFALRMALMFSAQLSASKKYWLAVTGLLAVTGWFVYTLVNEVQIYNWLAVAPSKLSAMPLMLELPRGIRQFNDQSIRYYYSIEEYLPYISIVYLAGLLFNSGRLILGRRRINIIKQTMSIDIPLQRKINQFAETLNIDVTVKVGLSKMVDVPCMVGYIKPIILLPFTLSTYLAAEEIEAILLHELAHIKRNDYIMNLLQQVISTLLFFNPCVQLINKIINEERENCCDDLVVRSTPNPIIYAKALLKLEETRENNMRMALAATGKKYYLLNRIQRIMKTKKPTSGIRPALLAMLILTIGMGCIALLNPQVAQGKISVKAIKPALAALLSDTGHKAKATASKKKTAAKKDYKVKNKFKLNKEDKSNYNFNYEDPELEKLGKEVEKHGQALSKYYDSPEFKKMSEEMEQRGKEMEAFYNRPELKKLEEEQAKLGQEFGKNWGETNEITENSAKMGALGEKMGKYFSSSEFKAKNEKLKKKYGIPQDYYPRNDTSENYKKYQAELEAGLPAEIKQATKELKTLGKQMKAHYDSPQFHAQSDRMKVMGDSLRRAFNNPMIKEQQEEMRKLGEKMREMNNNPEMKREKELLREASAKMKAYTHSREFKRRMAELRAKAEAFEKIERPEKPEKPEKPDEN